MQGQGQWKVVETWETTDKVRQVLKVQVREFDVYLKTSQNDVSVA